MRKPGDPTISTEAESGETFLGRWSRRKRDRVAESAADDSLTAPAGQRPLLHAERQSDQGAEQEPEQEHRQAAIEPTVSAAPMPVRAGDAEPAAVLTDADMPSLDGLGDDGDYSGFMSPGVSEGLRNKALRQLFMSPQFNVLDGLNDYDEDFTAFEALGDIVTSDMRHRVEMEAEKVARKTAAQRLSGGEAERQVTDAEHDGQATFAPQGDVADSVTVDSVEAQADDVELNAQHCADEAAGVEVPVEPASVEPASVEPVSKASSVRREQSRRPESIESPPGDVDDV